MKGLTAPQLCELTGFNFQRFETLRHRYAKAFSEPGTFYVDAHIRLPVKDAEPGRWTRYDFNDALRLGIAIALESAGLDIRQACSIASHTPIDEYFEGGESDLWVAYLRDADGVGGHRLGDLATIAKHLGGDTASAALANIATVARQLKKQAARMGFVTDGTRFLRVDDVEE
jgi:hypothetical protein